jgi:hypothetical protein
MAPDSIPEPLTVALAVASVFERLDIRYLAAGSLASSIHGEPRSTDDVDFVADVRLPVVDPLIATLGARYYLDADTVRGVRRGGEVSDRQWRDVLGILRTQGPRLDLARMKTWAPRIGVDDLMKAGHD